MSSQFELRSARFIAMETMEKVVESGDICVDATMGNGHDTLTLCSLVGENGKVYAFDVQPQAVENTRARLSEAGMLSRAELLLTGHQNMLSYVHEPVKLVLFNLGWLPGGDKSVTTLRETTLPAIKAALSLLMPLGVLSVCIYPGHSEGAAEREMLKGFFSALRPQEYNVLWHTFVNAGDSAPECVLIQRQP
ncbi:MAG: class I SAM-dependent methyltransferase [Eubacteriales bacterium]|nr:class I SAM-dependent methyltransferase [Eubacteriales bacterium]MDD3882713.1 class I SAM-dependent methyltransferase [Eubacteriales bacterium]MDD4512666.1 class I SAM-dependent methyltransferase [Eubacteriales bacterium]